MTYKALLPRLLPSFLLFTILVTTLDAQSLWWDEGISLHLTSLEWYDLLIDRATNIHPPLYFILLKLWVYYAGSSVFAARYLSLLATFMLPTGVHMFMRPLFSRTTVRAASLLVAVAPPFIIYGQEIRAYAFLPACFVLLLWQVSRILDNSDNGTPVKDVKKGIWLGVFQAIFVGLHYVGLIGVFLSDVALLANVIRKKQKRLYIQFITSISVFIILIAPWVAFVYVQGVQNVVQHAGISNPFSEPIPFNYLVKLLAEFHITGMPEMGQSPLLNLPIILIALCGFVLILVQLVKGQLHTVCLLLGIWLLPFLSVPLIWSLSPQSHPRYLFPYYLGFWLLAAYLIGHRVVVRVPKVLRLLFLSAVLTSSCLGTYNYLFDRTYSRTDIRAVADFLNKYSVPGDVVFIPHTDWSLPQYDVGAAQIFMVPAAREQNIIEMYLASAGNLSNAYLMDYPRNVTDPLGYVRFLLSRQGYLSDKKQFHKVVLEKYDITEIFSVSQCNPLPIACVGDDALCLAGSSVDTTPYSGTMLPVMLCWWHGAVDHRYALALRLYTKSGILVSLIDERLVDDTAQPSDTWAGQADFQSYHRIPIPVGLAPENYTLEVSLYPVDDPSRIVSFHYDDGTREPSVTLADIKPSAEMWIENSPESVRPTIEHLDEIPMPGLRLKGSALDPDVVTPGLPIYVTLLWIKEDARVGLTQPMLELIQNDNTVLTSVPAWGNFHQIPVLRPVLDHRVLYVPADAKAGDVQVVLKFQDADTSVRLGDVSVEKKEHIFTAPDIRYPLRTAIPDLATLLGYDISVDTELSTGEPFTVTLVWQAEKESRRTDLKIFVHLVDEEGTIVAQHDAKPVNWMRPTQSWLEGEILVDTHQMQWLQTKSGTGVIHVGMYDAVTGDRVLWNNGEDALKLPISISYEQKR